MSGKPDTLAPAPMEDTNASMLAPGVRAREVWAWAMFDFANSGYTTVVITAIFNAYFVAVVAEGAVWATFAWTAALSVSYLLIIVAGPALGAYADAYACKKRLLVWTTIGCIVFTAGLGAAGRGDVGIAIACLIASNVFFSAGENLIAAFLPELAGGDDLGKVSGWGWALGYCGGMLTLGLCLAYVSRAEARGASAEAFVPGTMLITAGVFLVAVLPTFILLKERARPQPHRPGRGALVEALSRTLDTVAHARRYQDLARFLVCIVFYQAGVQAVIALAAIYAQQVMGFDTRQTITLILVVNVTAAVGAFAFGYIQDRLGHLPTIALTLVGWLGMVVIAATAQGQAAFWIAANLAGVCLGSSQSAGRALVGYLSPEDRHGEFFGLWGLAVKLSSILGPLTYGIVTWATHGDHRTAFLITGLYFVAGLLILARIDVRRGREVALGAEPARGCGC